MRRDIFQAIADPTRRAILVLIAVQAMTPNAIAGRFDITRQSISKHLRILSECDLLAQKQEGREIYYGLKLEKMKEIDIWIDQFRKIMEENFLQLDEVLYTIKKQEKMNLLFDFTVNKDTATIHVTREFAADLDLVWDAFTNAEILDQWMGPKPWRVRTKEMDFRVGGRWLYTMVSAENVASDRFSLAEFVEIQPKDSFTTRNSFSDENGNPVNSGFTFSMTKNSFKAGAEKTTVEIVKKMASLAELEQFIAGGYYEKGIAMGMNNLEEYFQTLVASK